MYRLTHTCVDCVRLPCELLLLKAEKRGTHIKLEEHWEGMGRSGGRRGGGVKATVGGGPGVECAVLIITLYPWGGTHADILVNIRKNILVSRTRRRHYDRIRST